MAKYVTCVNCGSHLDFGEQCDCEVKKESVLPEQKRSKEINPASILPHTKQFVKQGGINNER